MRILGTILVLMLIVGCQASPSGEMTPEEIAEIEAEVREAATEQHNTWIRQEDLDAHVRSHMDWAGNPWGGTRTLDQMRERQRDLWARWDYEQTPAPDWEVMVLAPNVAAAKGSAELTRTDTTGLVQSYVADWAHVWVKVGGEWRMLVAKEAAEFRQ